MFLLGAWFPDLGQFRIQFSGDVAAEVANNAKNGMIQDSAKSHVFVSDAGASTFLKCW